jgi:uncharacterized protein
MAVNASPERYFADTWFWIALINQRDDAHDRAKAINTSIRNSTIVTSEMVLTELLNSFARKGRLLRDSCAEHARRLQRNSYVRIVPQSTECFTHALELYRARSDKNWSLTDCSSILIMRAHKITHALTNDHFAQAGLTLFDPG